MFFNILKIDGKTKFVKDLEKEKEIYNEFIEKYQEKNTFVKQFINAWHTADKSNLKKLKKEYKSIIKKNKKLSELINKLTVIDKKNKDIKDSPLFNLIRYNEKVHNKLSQFSDKNSAIKSIIHYIERVDEGLNAIKEDLKKQNNYIKKYKFFEGYLSLEKKGIFYRLMTIENSVFNNIKIHIAQLLSFINSVENPLYEDINSKLKRLKIMQITYSSKDFLEFYKILKKDFPKGEIESIDSFEAGFKAYKRWFDYTYHILIAKLDQKVIGGIVYENFIYFPNPYLMKYYEKKYNFKFKNPEKEICFGIIWWISIKSEDKHIKSEVGKLLEIYAERLMKKEAEAKGYPLVGIFSEINDPEKMTEKQKKKDIMDPIKRIRILRMRGQKRVLKEYVSIAVEFEGKVRGTECVYFTSLFVKPTIYKEAIPSEDLVKVVEGIQVESNDLDPRYSPTDKKFLRDFKPYQKMIKAILSKPYHKLE